MTRSENMEHVEVLRHMKETIKAIMPSEVAALDAAIASLSAQQPPAEAQPNWKEAPLGATHYQPHQGAYYKRVSASEWYVWSRVEDRELLRWLPSPGTSDSAEWVVRPTDAHPPPSSSVGVRYDAGLLSDYGGGNVGWWHDYIRSELDRAHDFYTEALAQQPAAVDGDNPYPAPRNRQEAAALARLALAYLGVTSAHIDAVVARCETDLAGQQGGGAS